VDLLGITLRSVQKAFDITKQFQVSVTFQLQIVWHLDPINDTADPVPSYTKTVLAVWYKPILRRIEATGGYVYTENICVQQWNDAPAPSISDRVLVPGDYGPQLRQVMLVNEDPAHATWIVETRLPTQKDGP
jgi:hypothetical protein